MKTVPKTTRRRITADEVRDEVRVFEAAHPGTNRTNYLDVFRDEHGELVETDEFFEISSLYHLLGTAERAR